MKKRFAVSSIIAMTAGMTLITVSGCNGQNSNAGSPTAGSLSEKSQTPAKKTTLTTVGDNFRLADIPTNSFSQLNLNKEIVIPKVTVALDHLASTPSYYEEKSTLHSITILDGRVLQDFTREQPCVDTETGTTLEADECSKIYDSAKCVVYWTPIKPLSLDSSKSDNNSNGAYWNISADYVFPLKRYDYSKNTFTHSDQAGTWDNKLNVSCKDVSKDSLTVGDLKRAFGSEVTLKVLQ